MKKNFVCLLIVLLFVSCSSNGVNNAIPSASIKILSVSPSTGLVDDTLTEFQIEIEYTLINSSQGEINIGFNNDTLSTTYIGGDPFEIVEGTHVETYTVTTITKYWSEDIHFTVYAGIINLPHESTYSALDSDYYELEFN